MVAVVMHRTLYYKGIQLPQLRSFCLAASEGNFTTAARALGLSVATVWQQVRSLERELGTTLLCRRGRNVELTSEGRLLMELVQPHISGLDSLVPLFHSRRAQLPVLFSVASSNYLVSYHLPRPVQEFAAQYPSVRLNLLTGIGSEGVERVEVGEVNLGVVSYDPDEPRSPAVQCEHLFDMHYTLITAADHPLARKKRVRPHDLVEYPIILQPRSGYNYRTLERLLRRHNLLDRMHIVLESPSTDTVLTYVRLGVGIALIYAGPDLARSLPGLRLRGFDPALPRLTVDLVVRKGAHLPEHAEAFCRLVHRYLKEPTNGAKPP